MAIINSITPSATNLDNQVAIFKDSLKTGVEFLKTTHMQQIRALWYPSDPTIKPQDILDALGDDAVEAVNLVKLFTHAVSAVWPDFVVLTPTNCEIQVFPIVVEVDGVSAYELETNVICPEEPPIPGLEEALAEIYRLLNDPNLDLTDAQMRELEQSLGRVEDALALLAEDPKRALDRLQQSMHELEQASELGLDTIPIITMILESVEAVIRQQIQDIEALVGPTNRNIQNAWELFDDALAAWAAGDYGSAIGLFNRAIIEAERAL